MGSAYEEGEDEKRRERVRRGESKVRRRKDTL